MFHSVCLEGMSIFDQLQLEEALFRADTRSWCLWNRGVSPAIVLGISSQVEETLHLSKLENTPVPVYRRFTGGGTVFVDPNTLFITWISDTKTLGLPPFPEAILQWSATLFQPLFPQDSFALLENDYVLKQKKWGGNALSIARDRWVHHCSLLWDFDEKHMEYLQVPKKAPLYREKRGHSQFLCRLKEYWETPDLFLTAFLQELQKSISLQSTSLQYAVEHIHKPHRKTNQELQPLVTSPPKLVKMAR